MGEDAAQDGLTIMMSPVQLAAVLEGKTLSQHSKTINRLWGGAGLLFSAVQLVGGGALLLTPEPTMLTKVGGGVLVAHGLDSGQASARQLWSGEPTEDLTQQAGEALARELGASDQTAYYTGVGIDIAVPLTVSLGLGAERILAVRAGRFSLVAEEAAGGHTIAKHVGQTEEALRARLVREPKIPAASSFSSLRIAEDVISRALKAEENGIRSWAQMGAKRSYVFSYKAGSNVGAGIVRGVSSMQSMSNVLIVLKKTQVGSRVYFVLTAFPQP